MRKILKIILSIFAVLVIGVVAFGAIVVLDVAAYTATGTQTLAPTGTSIGKALVLYDPGLSGTAKGVAEKVASDLQTQNFTVTLAGIKSSAAANTTSYSIIVIGGPVYAGALTSSVKDNVNKLPLDLQGAKVGIFGSGQGATSTDDINQLRQSISGPLRANPALSNVTVVKIGQSEDLNARAQDFVTQLMA
jgi:menaquinone-dependent protoporphyrinogen IX oxidase